MLEKFWGVKKFRKNSREVLQVRKNLEKNSKRWKKCRKNRKKVWSQEKSAKQCQKNSWTRKKLRNIPEFKKIINETLFEKREWF